MLDLKELKKFAALPSAFNLRLEREIEQAIDEYDEYRAYIVRLIDRKGEMAFRNPNTYLDVADDIRYEKYPDEEKLIQVIGDIYNDYFGAEGFLKGRNGKNEQQVEKGVNDLSDSTFRDC